MKNSRALAVMLPLLVLASLAAAYFAIEAYNRGRQIEALEQKLSAMPSKTSTARASIERSKSIQVKRVPRSVEKTVFCPLCEGEGEIIPKDPRGQDMPAYACPVCKAQGTLLLEVPRGKDLCPECGGTGKLGVAPKEGAASRYSARLCVKCNGKGWSRKRD